MNILGNTKTTVLDTTFSILNLAINFSLALSIFSFIIHLFGPILGGKLLYSALIIYGSRIGMALTMKFILKKVQNKIRMKFIELIFVGIYSIFCMFLWFPYPINIVFSLLIIVGNIAGYKAQKKWQDGSPV